MKILICGDRNWTNRDAIYRILYGFPHDTIVIHGACKGADTIADEIADKMWMDIRTYPANWDKLGLAAGPIRNREMLDKEHPDLVIAFHSNIKESKGTKDMCKEAKRLGVPVILIIA